jgi:hypothetical protein
MVVPAKTVVRLASLSKVALVAASSKAKGLYGVIEFERTLGRAIGLLRFRGRYGTARRTGRQPLGERR